MIYKVKIDNGVIWNQHQRNVFENENDAIQEYTKRNEEHKDLIRKVIRDKDDMIRVLYRQLNTDIEVNRLLKEVIEEKAKEFDIELELEAK
jgi:superoxide dismutase